MTPQPAPLAALSEPDAGLGLRQGQVTLVEHNPQWAPLADALADHIVDALVGHDVSAEHIGSTSVPGLAAKPMLDLAVGAHSPLPNNTAIARLEAAGFDFEIDLGMYGGLLFSASSHPSIVVAHIHVVSSDDFQWRWYLAFRDGLRSDPQLRAEYEDLKRVAATSHATDRESYTKAKFDWVLSAVSTLDAPPAGDST